jgi:hypothetical protein
MPGYDGDRPALRTRGGPAARAGYGVHGHCDRLDRVRRVLLIETPAVYVPGWATSALMVTVTVTLSPGFAPGDRRSPALPLTAAGVGFRLVGEGQTTLRTAPLPGPRTD